VGWAGHAACLREMINAYYVVGKREGKKPFRKHTNVWEDNNKVNQKWDLNIMRVCVLASTGSGKDSELGSWNKSLKYMK
jgi:hypothetical protein